MLSGDDGKSPICDFDYRRTHYSRSFNAYVRIAANSGPFCINCVYHERFTWSEAENEFDSIFWMHEDFTVAAEIISAQAYGTTIFFFKLTIYHFFGAELTTLPTYFPYKFFSALSIKMQKLYYCARFATIHLEFSA